MAWTDLRNGKPVTAPGMPAEPVPNAPQPEEPENVDRTSLHRIADLAAAVLVCLEKPNRGFYESERQLSGFLIKDGIGFTRSELPAALALLAAQNSLVRDEAAMGQPRGGRLPSVASDGPPEPSPEIMLGRTIIEVCRAGNGRSGRSTSPEILERLHDAGEDVTGDQLGGMLTRLADCRVLLRVRQSDAAPIAYVLAGEINGYDETDALEGSIMATLRARDGSYTDEESELKEWLAADGVAFSDRQFGHAIGDLFRWGHLFSPRPEEWRGVGPRPVWLREPPIRKG